MNKNEKTTKALKEELQKLTTAVSFNTWLQPLEVFQIDSDLKIAYIGVKRSGGIEGRAVDDPLADCPLHRFHGVVHQGNG